MAISSARTQGVYQPPQAGAGARVAVGNGSNGIGISGANGNSHSAPVVRSAPTRENPSLAAVTEAIKTGVEADDLDVPAFIRKR
jgi:hypothetical protein